MTTGMHDHIGFIVGCEIHRLLKSNKTSRAKHIGDNESVKPAVCRLMWRVLMTLSKSLTVRSLLHCTPRSFPIGSLYKCHIGSRRSTDGGATERIIFRALYCRICLGLEGK
jgi:hypothetical protein